MGRTLSSLRLPKARLGLLLGLTLGLAATLPLALPAQAAPMAPSSAHIAAHTSRAAVTTSSISGSVVNGTHGNTPVAGLQVTLQATDTAPLASGNATSAPMTHDMNTVTTDAQGHFTFTDVPAGTADVFAVYTHYQGGLYASQAITVSATSSNTTTLTIYDATTSDQALTVKNVTVLVRPPDVKHGLVGIGEFVTLQNSGNTAYVGDANATASGGMPALLRFAVPAGASNLTPGAGFVGAQVLTIGTGFGATATVPPGTSVFAFAYDLPYTGTSATYTYTPVYPTAQVIVLVPPTMRATPGQHGAFAAQGTVAAFDGTYQVYQTTSATPSAGVSLAITGLPEAGERGDLNFGLLVALGGVLALLAALALGLAVARGDLAFLAARFARPGAAGNDGRRAGAESIATKGARADERERLLREIALLEAPAGQRTMPQAERDRRIAALRAEARLLLADDLEGQPNERDEAPARTTSTTGGSLTAAGSSRTRGQREGDAE